MELIPPAVVSRSALLFPLIFFTIFLTARPSVAQEINSWTKPVSGYWEEQTNWSLGVLPDQTQSVMLTNAGWKALAIGANTAQNFPQSMQVQSLRVASPVDSYNVLLLNFSGFQQPLETGSLVVESNSTVVVQSSVLEVLSSTGAADLSLGGSFNHGDHSLVEVHGSLRIGSVGPGSYFLTNGTLTVFILEELGGPAPGKFVQYGGWNNLVNMEINQHGEYDLYGGQVLGTFFMIGLSGYDGSFFHYGGNVNADMEIGVQGYGRYVLNGGNLTGHMSVPSLERGNGYVEQSGGTNFAFSLEVGQGNRFGGQGVYVLSNGVVTVTTSTTLRGYGDFYQWNGLHMIASSLVMQGRDLFIYGAANAEYSLMGGTLSASALNMNIASFVQESGTSQIAGDVVIGPASQSSLYSMSGGYLSDSNVVLNASPDSGFYQTDGTHNIANQLTITGLSPDFWGYTLKGGILSVKNISISNSAVFHHSGGTINHSGLLTLAHGEWQTRPGDQALGPLLLATLDFAGSMIDFPDGRSVLRFANSSEWAWTPDAVLLINNWHGSLAGGGDTQLYFGSDTNGLTSQQLGQVQFNLPGQFYPARILPGGEVVPEVGPEPLAVSHSGNGLVLTWSPAMVWTLQSSTNVTGPYLDVPFASSPYTVTTSKPLEFFRLRQ